jgi:hypothetical protein
MISIDPAPKLDNGIGKSKENLLAWFFRSHEQVEVGFYAILPEVMAGLNYRLVVDKIK